MKEAERFQFHLSFPIQASYNIAPTQNVLVVKEEEGERVPDMFR